jgi:ADP-ribose pyrophosphatase YjhB (NUDIX family)
MRTGEALGLAAEREVEEETGIKAEFQGIITFR